MSHWLEVARKIVCGVTEARGVRKGFRVVVTSKQEYTVIACTAADAAAVAVAAHHGARSNVPGYVSFKHPPQLHDITVS